MAHAALEVFLVLNDAELRAEVDEQEKVFLDLAAGRMTREAFSAWVEAHLAEA